MATSETEQPLQVRVALALGWEWWHTTNLKTNYNSLRAPNDPISRKMLASWGWVTGYAPELKTNIPNTIPPFELSLDACVPAIAAWIEAYKEPLSEDQYLLPPIQLKYSRCLTDVLTDDGITWWQYPLINATAEQRCRAFLACVRPNE